MYQSSKTFNKKPVVDISTETEPQALSKISPMIGFEDYGSEKSLQELFDHFLQHQDTSKMDSLVIGNWAPEYEYDDTSGLVKAIEMVTQNKDKYPALKSLFMGAIEQEQSEISWIELVDYAPLLNTGLPDLEYFRARGNGDFFTHPIKSTLLKKLALETGGLSKESVINISQSDLPNLEYLELWIGSEEYGSTTIEHIKTLLESSKFPKLRYLGLRNCEFIDDITKLFSSAPLIAQLDILDLSLGNLSDKGAKVLANTKSLSHLKKLIIDHHYVEDEEIITQLKALITDFSYKDKEEADDDDDEIYRYIMVSE